MTGRRIGPIGTAARLAGALAAVATPLALAAVTWWDVGAALVALPLTAVLATQAIAVARSTRPAAADRGSMRAEIWIRSSLVLLTVIAVEVAATFATPLDGATSIFLFVGLSLFVAAGRGDAGCEAVAIPNALTGRRDSTGCVVFSPVDMLDGSAADPWR